MRVHRAAASGISRRADVGRGQAAMPAALQAKRLAVTRS
jgi:hypothetical protein